MMIGTNSLAACLLLALATMSHSFVVPSAQLHHVPRRAHLGSALNDAAASDAIELVGAAEQAADSAAASASSIASVAAEQAADSSAAAAAAAADAGSIASVVADPIVQSAAVEPVLPDLPAAVAPSLDLEVVSLVCGQENYGLAIVALGEALWSFLQAPSADHALKTFGPAAVAAVVLVAVSGPMVTSGDAASVTLGLEIATGVSMLLGLSYLARLLAPYSPSSKEIAFLGLLVSLAGFFSFSQNLLVDGFVALPSIPLPKLPSLDIDLSFFNFD